MAQITDAERVQRIRTLINELNKVPPDRHEVERLPWHSGDPLLCQVITIGVDDVLLNHNSHRVRAQLQDDPEWQEHSNNPHCEAAQTIIQRQVRKSRSPEQFAALKESLQHEGQIDPGVMTHDGVLVNANTRAVALRELEDPAKRYIRVAVLPESANPAELALLELRLQMQKELKVDYSLTNELLFIEELSSERGLSDAYIARELRIFPESEKKGASEVGLRLQMLDVIRQMQRIPKDGIPLTFFDSLSYEQFRELLRIYGPLVESDPAEARMHLESFLLSVAVGVTPVHQLRRIDTSFMSDYMLPQLEEDEDEVIGKVATVLATASSDLTASLPVGASSLLRAGSEELPDVNVKQMIDAVTQKDKTVVVPGTDMTLPRDELRDAIRGAITTGINEKRRDGSTEDKLEAPIDAVKNATKQLGKCLEAFGSVRGAAEFDAKRRRSLEAAFKRLKRTLRGLEVALVKAKVIPE